MQFELFHSIGRVDSLNPKLTDRGVFENFFEQTILAESLGFHKIWVAESHFSTEVQKRHPKPVVPHYHGEIGLNADSFQLAHMIFSRTKKIGFGTAILNIVGGNGGPLAAADRVNMMRYFNQTLENPRSLSFGIAAGRFPYINAPFGISPRNSYEEALWPVMTRFVFLEALEVFLRACNGETFSSSQVTQHFIQEQHCKSTAQFIDWFEQHPKFRQDQSQLLYPSRWSFPELKLVPEVKEDPNTNFVLGSHDPLARHLALKFSNVDIFNLSFTPPDEIEKIHKEMTAEYKSRGFDWHRSKLPRTVLVFIDQDEKRARLSAEHCFDTYIEAMRGTVALPPKQSLIDRALIGTPKKIIEQLSSDHLKGFHKDDRLMLWFEFNQNDNNAICSQMKLFSEQVIPYV